jgi:YegS/Rv2252/BmrU family lipid kinase
MGMKYVFLLNKFSLKDRLYIVRSLIEKVCKELNISYVVEINSDEVSTEDIVKKYKGEKVVLCAVGGDGIINRVLNAMDMDSNTLSFIPSGTGNDFYKSCLEQFEDGLNDCDLVSINDKYFINTCCFGIDADIANNSDIIHSRLIPKSQRYNASLLYNFLKYKVKHMVVKIDDEVIDDHFTTVVLCNGKYYGGGYKIGFNSKLNDDLIDVYLVPKMPKLGMAKLILGMNKGNHEKSEKVKKYHVRKITIESEKDITCNIDGEELTANKFNVEVKKNKIKILFNKELIDKIKKST